MEYYSQLILFLISLIANIFSAFSGGGAGLIQLPVLLFLGLPFSTALATHKVASVALGIGATLRHFRNNTLERHFTLFILLTGLPGVVVGANIILEIPEQYARFSLGALILGLGIYSSLNKALGQHYQPLHRNLHGYISGGLVIFFIGILNGSLTSGTGLFVTLWLIRWYGLDYKRAVAYTLVLVGLFWNGAGAITLGILSQIQWNWLPALLLGSLLGGYIGAHLSIIKGNQLIKRAFEVITILVGLKLMLGNF